MNEERDKEDQKADQNRTIEQISSRNDDNRRSWEDWEYSTQNYVSFVDSDKITIRFLEEYPKLTRNNFDREIWRIAVIDTEDNGQKTFDMSQRLANRLKHFQRRNKIKTLKDLTVTIKMTGRGFGTDYIIEEYKPISTTTADQKADRQ